MMRKVVSIGVVAATLAMAFVWFVDRPKLASVAAQAKGAGVEVKIDNFSFAPATLTVAPGTTVTWTNRDDIPHTVVSSDDPKVFKSKVLDTDEKFLFTFSKAGTYAYFCSVHPKMTGKVVVQ